MEQDHGRVVRKREMYEVVSNHVDLPEILRARTIKNSLPHLQVYPIRQGMALCV